ncbi:heme-binding protein soul2 [Megalops cyprinoides]|uniref:heme-binding protein soul2 n=1 Tax=Megalops cyprinoides TaxID=118141 RepID=UPI00186566F4|nr:heme-binding protein soul2 [Megalops cyprinoides]
MRAALPALILSVSWVLVSPQPPQDGWTAPWFCHGYECPPYTVVHQYENFEERLYNATRWMSTEVEDSTYTPLYNGFMRLYSYTDGANEAGQQLALTRPVAVTVLDSDSGETKQVSIALYIGPYTDPPKPTDASIKDVSVLAGTVYVRQFSGVAHEADWLENLASLKSDLRLEGKQYNSQKYVAAGYDPPWTLINRHNEVWIPAA